MKFIVRVGSSTVSIGNASGASGEQIVDPIPISSMPLISTMSPRERLVPPARDRAP